MEGLSTSWGYCSGLVTPTKDTIDQAKEELQILEAQQPNGFNHLKLELKSFISHLESQILLLPSDNDDVMNMVSCFNINPTSLSISSTVTTQGNVFLFPVILLYATTIFVLIKYCSLFMVSMTESSVGKKRKKGDSESRPVMEGKNIEAPKKKFQRAAVDGCVKRRDRIDVVVEKARACLQKIQEFKTSFS